MFSRDCAVKYSATIGREGNAGKVSGGRLMRLTKLFVLLALAGGGAAEAATLNASSCNLSAVSLVVTSAVDGDTVVIPAGTCSWSGPLASLTSRSR